MRGQSLRASRPPKQASNLSGPGLGNTRPALHSRNLRRGILPGRHASWTPPAPKAKYAAHVRAWIGRLPLLAVGYAEVRLLNGDVFTVEGALDEVESKLSDAARSGQPRLAWFTEYGTDGPLGVNPAHVVTLKVSEISD